MEEKSYSVSEAVRLVGVESHVLRYWEDELNISIQRNAQGHRIYSSRDIKVFRKAKDWKEKGLQLKAIRVLLEQSESSDSAGAVSFKKQMSDTLFSDHSQCDIEGGACSYEIVPTIQETQDSLNQIAAVFRQIVEEVAETQNERLEQMLATQLREEARDLYLQYFQMLQEAACARTSAEDRPRSGKFRRIWDILSGREE